MDSLSEASNINEIRKLLSGTTWDLTIAYQQTLNRILDLPHNRANLAKRALIWVCYSERPLNAEELQHALAIEEGNSILDEENLTHHRLIVSACMGLLVLGHDNIFNLVHLTAYEFFRKTTWFDLQASQYFITKSCLAYLSYKPFSTGPSADLSSFQKRLTDMPFARYAACFWGRHAIHVQKKIMELVLPFLENTNIRASCTQLVYYRERKDPELQLTTFQRLPTGRSSLQTVCREGLLLFTERLLANGADISETDDQGWTPLISAASYGQQEVLNFLIGWPLSSDETLETRLNIQDRHGWTALFWCVLKGNLEGASRLLDAGASTDVRDLSGWTSSDWAAYTGNADFLRLVKLPVPRLDLLSLNDFLTPWRFNGAEREVVTFKYLKPAYLAIASQNLETLNTIILNANHDDRVAEQMEALTAALSNVECISSLDSGVGTHHFTTRLLDQAIKLNHLELVKILVELGADLGPIKIEKNHLTPLHVAIACCKTPEIPAFLVTRGANIDARDKRGLTSLDRALVSGSKAVFDMLLEVADAETVRDVNLEHLWRNDFENISLEGTCFNGSHGLSLDLLEREMVRAELQLEDQFCEEAALPHPNKIQRYIKTQILEVSESTAKYPEDENTMDNIHSDIIQALVARGLDVNKPDEEGKTALFYAVKASSLHGVEALIKNGSNVNAQDNADKTVLHDLYGVGTDVIKLLLERGAAIDSKDNNGKTPLHRIFLRQDTFSRMDVERAQFLVSQGANVNVCDARGVSLLHTLASVRYHKTEWFDLIETILSLSTEAAKNLVCEYGYFRDPPRYDEEVESKAAFVKHQETPLAVAIRKFNWPIIERLIKHGARVHNTASISWRECALSEDFNAPEHKEHIKILLSYLKDQNVLLNAIGRALEPEDLPEGALYSTEGDWDQVKAWYLAHSSRDEKSSISSTFGPYASTTTNGEIKHKELLGKAVLLLIDCGADVNEKNIEGITPLHAAASSPRALRIVQALVEKGADPFALDKNGKTPLDYGRAAGCEQIISVLSGDCPTNTNPRR